MKKTEGYKKIHLANTPFDIYRNYKRLIASGQTPFKAQCILADLNLCETKHIKEIVQTEREKEKMMGVIQYMHQTNKQYSHTYEYQS
jgi:2-phospho-L-lactate guanylyltransferase (CobY/MobA/RfbA family)